LPAGALWQLIQRSTALAGTGHPAHARAAAGSIASGAPAAAPPELPDPAAVLAAAEAVAGDVATEPDAVADLARGLATALESTQGTAGRSALAATAEVVPPRQTSLASTAVSVPVGERGWERAFGERVVWLVGQQVQAAEVKLNPPHLGPVEVRLSLNGQEASVSFTVAHGATRDAIEQAIPRLRELFAEQQLQIVNVDVGQRDAAGQASQGDRWGQAARPVSGAMARAAAADAEPVVRVRGGGLPGLVDEYA
jgi:flagellar hook-length control protein FliK